jgi:hypothetical protein
VPDLTIEIIRTAFHYATIRNDPTVSASQASSVLVNGPVASRLILNNLASFETLLWDEVNRYPYFRRFFSHLVAARLRQENVLSSPLLGKVFSGLSTIEGRLSRIQVVAGIDALVSDYQPAADPRKGNRTDEIAADYLAEILVLDFLVDQRFEGITKVVADPNTPHIDVLAEYQSKRLAVEITRKKENAGWSSLAYGNLADCTSERNQKKMREIISLILKTKSDQFRRSIEAGSLETDSIRVVAIKLSDFSFQDCIQEASMISFSLLGTGEFGLIDIVWLVPDIESSDSCWIDPSGRLTTRWSGPGQLGAIT